MRVAITPGDLKAARVPYVDGEAALREFNDQGGVLILYFKPEHREELKKLIGLLDEIDVEQKAVIVAKTDHVECAGEM